MMKFSGFYRWYSKLPAWSDWAFIVTLITAFTLISLPLLGLNSLDFDEGFSAYIARFDPLSIAHYTALDVHPPLYYIFLHYWGVLFGTDVPTLRLLSVAWGGITLLFGFMLVRKAFGKASAWIASLLLAVSPLFFHYSHIMRMYTMALAISVIATYVLLHATQTATKQKQRLLWLLYALLVAAGMWTNYFVALVWVAHFIWLIYKWRVQGVKGRKLPTVILKSEWLKAVCLAIVLYLAWLPALIYRFIEVQGSGFWIKPLSMDTLVSTITMAMTYHKAAQTTGWYTVIILIIATGAVAGGMRLYRMLNKSEKSAFMLLIITSALPIVLLILLSLPPLQSSYVYRYVLTAIGVGSLVLGVVFTKAPFVLWKKSILTVAVLSLGITGCIHAVRAGNQNLDIGQITMVGQSISDIYATSERAPIIVRSVYNYYAAAAYEQPNEGKIFFIFNEQLGKIGSTRMLYDFPEARGIQNMESFLRDNTRLWILSGDRATANHPPGNGWQKGRSITKYDPESGKPGTYAVEYYR